MTLVSSTWTPLTNDLATGLTTFFGAVSDESGEMVLFDNTIDKVLFELNEYNTSTEAFDTAMAINEAYSNDAYSMTVEFTWLASEVADTQTVGWCIEAVNTGTSCWTLTKDGTD